MSQLDFPMIMLAVGGTGSYLFNLITRSGRVPGSNNLSARQRRESETTALKRTYFVLLNCLSRIPFRMEMLTVDETKRFLFTASYEI